MNRLSCTQQELILKCLLDGNSIRATSRITGHARNTISSLLARAGTACAKFHDKMVRNISAKRVEVDEIWGFCEAKDKSIKRGKKGYGSVWSWLAIDKDTKLLLSYHLGKRTESDAKTFMKDLSARPKMN